jgi:predicted dehydrogenase
LGVPLFIEKPVLHKNGLGLEIEKKIGSQNVNTYVGCNLRFLDCIRYIKKYIDERSPRINEINVYSGSYLPNWRESRDFREIYSANPELGGGVHLDLIHEIDYIRWMFGRPNKVTRTFRANSSLGIKANDYANYVLVYPDFVASVILNYYRRDSRRICELVLDEETILVDLMKNSVTSSRIGCLMESKQTVGDTYVEQMKYFFECVHFDRRSFNNFSDGLEVLSICM